MDGSMMEEGKGARFRSHYITLYNNIARNLSTALYLGTFSL